MGQGRSRQEEQQPTIAEQQTSNELCALVDADNLQKIEEMLETRRFKNIPFNIRGWILRNMIKTCIVQPCETKSNISVLYFLLRYYKPWELSLEFNGTHLDKKRNILVMAVCLHKVECVEALVTVQIKQMVYYESCIVALYHAAAYGNPKMMTLLLGMINTFYERRYTGVSAYAWNHSRPLLMVIQHGHLECLTLLIQNLLKHQIFVDFHRYMFVCVMYGNVACFEYLLDQYYAYYPSKKKSKAEWLFLIEKEYHIPSALDSFFGGIGFGTGLDVALFFAVCNGHFEMAQYLVKNNFARVSHLQGFVSWFDRMNDVLEVLENMNLYIEHINAHKICHLYFGGHTVYYFDRDARPELYYDERATPKSPVLCGDNILKMFQNTIQFLLWLGQEVESRKYGKKPPEDFLTRAFENLYSKTRQDIQRLVCNEPLLAYTVLKREQYQIAQVCTVLEEYAFSKIIKQRFEKLQMDQFLDTVKYSCATSMKTCRRLIQEGVMYVSDCTLPLASSLQSASSTSSSLSTCTSKTITKSCESTEYIVHSLEDAFAFVVLEKIVLNTANVLVKELEHKVVAFPFPK